VITGNEQHNEKRMNETNLLLKAYYEALYERLVADKALLAKRIEELLTKEIAKRKFEGFDEDKFAAYRDASLAFVDERLEAYNPFGIQYTFGHIGRREAIELELQLNWYDSRQEFEDLVEAAHRKAESGMDEQRMQFLANELIKEAGAFPDKSIISAYEAEPALNKLPDYIVAGAIEKIIRE